jgi:hypothetical protein
MMLVAAFAAILCTVLTVNASSALAASGTTAVFDPGTDYDPAPDTVGNFETVLDVPYSDVDGNPAGAQAYRMEIYCPQSGFVYEGPAELNGGFRSEPDGVRSDLVWPMKSVRDAWDTEGTLLRQFRGGCFEWATASPGRTVEVAGDPRYVNLPGAQWGLYLLFQAR